MFTFALPLYPHFVEKMGTLPNAAMKMPRMDSAPLWELLPSKVEIGKFHFHLLLSHPDFWCGLPAPVLASQPIQLTVICNFNQI